MGNEFPLASEAGIRWSVSATGGRKNDMATWFIDPAHTSVTFGVKHMMVTTVRGRLGKAQGRIDFDPAHPQRTVIDVAIDPSTVDTGDEKRDGHLKSPDFFDVATYPKITFRSTKVEAKDGHRYVVSGNLTIRDVTKPVSFETELEGIADGPQGGKFLGATATLAINRTDWGLVWNMPIPNGVLVGEKVRIELGLEALDADAAQQRGLAA